MNGSQLSTSLKAFARLTSDSSLFRLSEALEHSGPETTSKIVSKVKNYWKAVERSASHPVGLKHQLEAVKSTLEVSASPTAAKDYAALLTLFDGHGGADIAAFVADLVVAINTPVPQKPKKVKTNPIDVRQIADRLTSLTADNAAFDAEIRSIEENSKIKKTDLKAVADRFLGYEGSFKARADIVKAIKARQLQDAIQGSRDKRGEKIAV